MICSRFLGKLNDIPPLSDVGWCHVKKSRNSPELISGKIQVQGSKYSDILFKNNPISKFKVFSQVYDSWCIPLPLVHLYLLFPSICLLGRLKQWVARCCLSGCLADGSPAVSGKNDLQRFIAAATATSWRISHVGGRQVGVWWDLDMARKFGFSRVFLIDPKKDTNDFDGWHKWKNVAFCVDFNW